MPNGHYDQPETAAAEETGGGPVVKVLTMTFVIPDAMPTLDVVKTISDAVPEDAELVTLNLNNQRRFWI